jgi:ABC-type glutathione transport system ATPase component
VTTPLLAVSSLTVRFRARRPGSHLVTAVDDVSFSVAAGSTMGLMGESGSGKSTIARAIVGLVQVSAGRIIYDGSDITGRLTRLHRRQIQMIFQDPFSSLNPWMSVSDIVEEGLRVHRLGDRAARANRVRELLELVGLDFSAGHRKASEFSGGQRQRIAIARALAVEPRVLICDEVVASLDVSIQILNLLRDLQARLGLTMLFIGHDLPVMQYMCDEVVVMARGKAVETGPARTVFGMPQSEYTRALLAAVPTGFEPIPQ